MLKSLNISKKEYTKYGGKQMGFPFFNNGNCDYDRIKACGCGSLGGCESGCNSGCDRGCGNGFFGRFGRKFNKGCGSKKECDTGCDNGFFSGLDGLSGW
jgi:hypothetical protein